MSNLFPESFGIKESESVLKKIEADRLQKIREEELQKSAEELENAIAFVTKHRDFYLGKQKEYFMIDLKNFNKYTIKIVMQEVLEKFVYVGCPGSLIRPTNTCCDTNNPFGSLLSDLGANRPTKSSNALEEVMRIYGTNSNKSGSVGQRKIRRIYSIDGTETRYIVALTEDFGKKMTEWNWPGKN